MDSARGAGAGHPDALKLGPGNSPVVVRNYGAITSDDGRRFDFHCTQIADGTRTIQVGQVVDFGLLPKLGRYEATAIDPA